MGRSCHERKHKYMKWIYALRGGSFLKIIDADLPSIMSLNISNGAISKVVNSVFNRTFIWQFDLHFKFIWIITVISIKNVIPHVFNHLTFPDIFNFCLISYQDIYTFCCVLFWVYCKPLRIRIYYLHTKIKHSSNYVSKKHRYMSSAIITK